MCYKKSDFFTPQPKQNTPDKIVIKDHKRYMESVSFRLDVEDQKGNRVTDQANGAGWKTKPKKKFQGINVWNLDKLY